jgi:uncharacterized protein YjiS (DUF1127 family)
MNKLLPGVSLPLRGLQALAHRLIRRIDRLARALQNRKSAAILAGFDERMLADIGLNRSDLRDAFAEPLWRDPSAILVDRACERRTNRVPVTFGRNSHLTTPSTAPTRSCGTPARAA